MALIDFDVARVGLSNAPDISTSSLGVGLGFSCSSAGETLADGYMDPTADVFMIRS